MSKLLIAVSLLSGCAWYREQWRVDGPCVPLCARALNKSAAEVLATRDADGICRCRDLGDPVPPRI
jgi:hypothetical protein